MIVAGADNRLAMLDKPMYESWKSCMELYVQGKDHRWIILNLVENGPLVWPTVEQENGTVRLECLPVLTFLPGDDPIACMNKAMVFLSAVFSPRYPSINNQLISSSNPRNQATIQDSRVTVQQVQGRQGQNVVSQDHTGMLQVHREIQQTITHNAAFQTDDLDAYDSNCDDMSSAKAYYELSPIVDYPNNEITSDM
nr:hypothetical protein [Tanacetum cinerariifolium]